MNYQEIESKFQTTDDGKCAEAKHGMNSLDFLKRKATESNRRPQYAFYMGAIHAVLKKNDGKGYQGAAEKRRDGIAAGI